MYSDVLTTQGAGNTLYSDVLTTQGAGNTVYSDVLATQGAGNTVYSDILMLPRRIPGSRASAEVARVAIPSLGEAF